MLQSAFFLAACFVLIISGIPASSQSQRDIRPGYPPSAGSGSGPAERRAAIPQKLRVPGEWEEIQAVIIAWPYMTRYDGVHRDIPDTTDFYPPLCAELAAAIQQECEVWIVIWHPGDSLTVKNYMTRHGTDLSRYKFIVNPGNGIWVRDSGPLGFYYGEHDSIGFLDLRYSVSRVQDDNLPSAVAGMGPYRLIPSDLFLEGGNFETDGAGRVFFSSRLVSENARHNEWSSIAIGREFRTIMKSHDIVQLQELRCDGGTGHIDLYMKLFDEQTIALARYADSVSAPDRQIIEDNAKQLSSLTASNGKPYRIIRIPMPASDDGSYRTECSELNSSPRTYLNGLFVNKSFLLPVFSDESSGYRAGDSEAVEIFRKALPGYRIIPIDSRIITRGYGGIHCITMQVPAENPIRFLPVELPSAQADNFRPAPVSLEIINRDGIRSAYVNWRKRGTSGWYSYRLAGHNLKNFSGMIATDNYLPGDTVDYYFEAESYNGKTMTKPMTAPLNSYSFVIARPGMQAAAKQRSTEEAFSLSVWPEQAEETATIRVSTPGPETVTITILDVNGRTVENIMNNQSIEAGSSSWTLLVNNYPAGTYFCTVSTGNRALGMKKFIVGR